MTYPNYDEFAPSTERSARYAKLYGPVKAQLTGERAPETAAPAEIERRLQLAKTNGIRNFGPTDGVCWNCHKQIFTVLSGEKDITGCPHCHRSYCD